MEAKEKMKGNLIGIGKLYKCEGINISSSDFL
jgi:hypothetical protein